MKQLLALLLTMGLLLLSACGEGAALKSSDPPEGPASREISAPEAEPLAPKEGPLTSEEKALVAQAEEFAVNFAYAGPFSATRELAPDRFVLLKLYEEHLDWEDESGIVWVPLEEFSREVYLRFGMEDYQFISPEGGNVYPRYVAEKDAVAFYAGGGGSPWAVELAERSAEGDVRTYTFNIYDDFITDGHEERTWERQLRYIFRVVRREDGRPQLQAVSAEEV